MNNPKEPNIDEFGINLNDFGISKKDLEKAEKFEQFKNGDSKYALVFALSSIISLIIVIKFFVDPLLFTGTNNFVFVILMIAFLFLCFIVIIFLVAPPIIMIIEITLVSLDIILFRKAKKYLKSVEECKKKLGEQKRIEREELEKQRRESEWQKKQIYMAKYEYWASLNGHIFEKEVSNLLRKFYEKVIHTKGSGDHGIDIIIRENGEDVPIQCKAHNKKISPATVRELLGVMVANKYKKGIIITVNGASDIAQRLAKANNVKIWDASHLISFQEKILSK